MAVPARMRSLRRALILLGVAGVVAGAVPLVLALSTQGGHHRGLIAIFGPLIGWAFIGTGLFAWYRRPENRFGALMIAVGFSYCASGLIVAEEPWAFIVGLLFIPLPYAILYHILLAFPAGHVHDRTERLLVVTAYISAVVAHPLLVLFQNTSRQGLPENPLLVADEPGLLRALIDARFTVGLLLLAAAGIILARRWREATGSQRRALTPVLLSGGLVMGLFALWYVAGIVRAPQDVQELLEQARVVALATVPFAFLAGLLSSRVAGAAAVSELVSRLGAGPDERRAGLRDALAEALGDPSVTLAFWLPDRQEYVDAEGHPLAVPTGSSARTCTPIEDESGPVAAIIHDAALAEDRELVRAVGAAASLALENERLDAELRAKVEELRASRARIVESADEARRRIERDLHDGAQQQLVALAITLRLARAKFDASPETARDLLEAAGRELDEALRELRELARGIHPAVLSERGLDSALRALAGRMPVPVELGAMPADPLPTPIEAAAYFVVAEAITNVARYAQASHATVQVSHDYGRVVVEVSDDGVGGAAASAGSGLHGLADRVAALDGELEIASPPGGGTRLRVRLPCA
jgi:signal transduction histidine kinase